MGAAALVSLAAPAVSTAKKGGVATKATAPTVNRHAGASSTKQRSVGKRTTRRRGAYSPYVGQLRPAPERIQEIERALMEKGFLAGEPDGNWDQTSIEALRHFQQSQNLTADGRLSSISLIALGLGARQNGVVLPDSPPPTSPPAAPAPVPEPIASPPMPALAVPPPMPAPVVPVAQPVAVIARPAVAPVMPVVTRTVAPPPPPAPLKPAPPQAPQPQKSLPLVIPDTSIPAANQ